MKAKTRKKRRIFLRAVLLILLTAAVTVVVGFAYAASGIDFDADANLFESARTGSVTRIYVHAADGDQTIINTNLPNDYYPKEVVSERLYGEDNRIWVPFDEIPERLKWAFIAIEDRRFYQHEGVDVYRTAGAAANYFLRFDKRFGGSTITQQLVKNVIGDRDTTVWRKMREMIRAVRLEETYSKDEILEMYLNVIPMSHNCSGVVTAANVYFNKPLSELSLAECASLAAIVNSPSRYDPFRQPENHRLRRNLILSEMKEQGYISEQEYLDASNTPLVTSDRSEDEARKVNSWYTDTVVDDVARDLAVARGISYQEALHVVYTGGLHIYTCMDESVQKTIEKYMIDLGSMEAGPEYAMVVVDPQNGDLLGIVGRRGQKSANRLLNCATVKRPPGSSLKPLALYAPAIEEKIINWATVFDDIPMNLRVTKDGYTSWPHNADLSYQGLITTAEALQKSKNTVAVQIYNQLGKEKIYSYLTEKLGIEGIVRSRMEEDGRKTDLAAAPLALGQLTDGVSLRNLVSAYTALADGGVYHPGRSYYLVTSAAGEVLLKKDVSSSRVFSEETATILTKMLEGVIENGTARTVTLNEIVDVAGKTGTSGDRRDVWFVGYTPYYLCGIWCGHTDSTPLEKGSYDHLSVWDNVMHALHRPILMAEEDLKEFRIAPGVIREKYCADSGALPSENCELDPRNNRIRIGYFTADNCPNTRCTTHRLLLCDKKTKLIASALCPSEDIVPIALPLLPTRTLSENVFVKDSLYAYPTDPDVYARLVCNEHETETEDGIGGWIRRKLKNILTPNN